MVGSNLRWAAIATGLSGAMLPLNGGCSAGGIGFGKSQPDAAVTAPGSRMERDVAYVEHGHAQQRLDIYAPAHAKNAPVVVYIHGGEWTKHDKSEVGMKPRYLNENGIIFVSANYRLSGVAKHPAQIDDVAAAVHWVHDHIDAFGGDPQWIVLMGHSAGCHLVTLAGLDPRPLAKFGMKPGDLRTVVSWSGGAFDLVQKVRDGGMYAGYIRATFGEDERTWRDASPVNHVGEAMPMPRFAIVSAEKDKPASIEASRRLAEMIRRAGGQVQSFVLPGKDHGSADRSIGAAGDASGDLLLAIIRGNADGSRVAAGMDR